MIKPGESDIDSVSLMVTCALVLLVVPPMVIVPVLLTFICALADKVTAHNALMVRIRVFMRIGCVLKG